MANFWRTASQWSLLICCLLCFVLQLLFVELRTLIPKFPWLTMGIGNVFRKRCDFHDLYFCSQCHHDNLLRTIAMKNALDMLPDYTFSNGKRIFVFALVQLMLGIIQLFLDIAGMYWIVSTDNGFIWWDSPTADRNGVSEECLSIGFIFLTDAPSTVSLVPTMDWDSSTPIWHPSLVSWPVKTAY